MDRHYNNGPEGMPRVKRMTDSTLNCIIRDSLFSIFDAFEGEDRDRLYGLLHDTAEEVLARVPAWPATQPAEPAQGVGLTEADFNLLGSAATWLMGNSNTMWARDYEHSTRMQMYATRLWQVRAILARQTAPTAERAAVPEGFKLVPLIPTDAMRTACKHCYYAEDIDEDWAAMLAAAPSPAPAAQEGETGSRLYAWLAKTAKCGLADVEAAAKLLKDYYEGASPQEGKAVEGGQFDLTACANCLRPKCEHNGKLCPPPYTTHWNAWDYTQPQPTFPEYAAQQTSAQADTDPSPRSRASLFPTDQFAQPEAAAFARKEGEPVNNSNEKEKA